jgi:Uma2 family endonuclease
VVFAAPAVNIEQSVGRVLRSPDASPVIIDVADVWSIFNAQTRKRRAFYHSRGFVVVTKGHWVGQGNPDDSMVDRGRSSRDSFPNNSPAFVNEED